MTFTISPEQGEKIAAFVQRVNADRGTSYAGASGGATSYEFTPTSLGVVFKVTHFGQVLDLTNYEDW